MRRALVVVAVAVVLAGCTGPVGPSDDAELPQDGLGVVDGVAYDDEIPVSVDDGLNQTELDLLVARSMARIEVVRGLEFEERVDVQIQTRAAYRDSRRGGEGDAVSTRWENRVWEAKFIVGQDRDVTDVLDQTMGVAVQGYYSPSSEEIVVVTDEETATPSKETLVHELVHALQDQQFGLDSPPQRQDPAMARDGVVEGEAELVTERYFKRCEGEWSCLEPPASGDEGSDIDPGIIRVIIHPYHKGPEFIEAIEDTGGWESVDDLHDDYPASTAQIIEPERYPDERPVNVTVEDRSTDDWSTLDHDPTGETVGQAAVHVMFWHNEVITVEEPYSYSHPVSDGWAGDELVPYENDGETGYVWELEWETAGDAEAFHDAYLDLLGEHGALERGPRQFVIPEGSYEGAFDVYLDGTTVTIVKGPDVNSLSAIHELDG